MVPYFERQTNYLPLKSTLTKSSCLLAQETNLGCLPASQLTEVKVSARKRWFRFLTEISTSILIYI